MSKPSATAVPAKLSTTLRVSADQMPLYAELRTLIASSRQRLAGVVNAELARLYWPPGQRLCAEVLGGAEWVTYGDPLVNRVGQQLAHEFGRGFEVKNLRRMVKFAESFPDAAIVSTLSTQLSWSHMVAIVALKTPQARQYYAQQARERLARPGVLLEGGEDE